MSNLTPRFQAKTVKTKRKHRIQVKRHEGGFVTTGTKRMVYGKLSNRGQLKARIEANGVIEGDA